MKKKTSKNLLVSLPWSKYILPFVNIFAIMYFVDSNPVAPEPLLLSHREPLDPDLDNRLFLLSLSASFPMNLFAILSANIFQYFLYSIHSLIPLNFFEFLPYVASDRRPDVDIVF